MKLHLVFEVEVDDLAVASYKAQYPGFAHEPADEILIREAIAAWEWDGLIVGWPDVAVRGETVVPS